jgi:hypothetical protein
VTPFVIAWLRQLERANARKDKPASFTLNDINPSLTVSTAVSHNADFVDEGDIRQTDDKEVAGDVLKVDGQQLAHVHILAISRRISRRLVTRMTNPTQLLLPYQTHT